MDYRIEILDIPNGIPASMLTDGKLFLDLTPESEIVPIKKLNELSEINDLKIDGAYASGVPITKINNIVLGPLIQAQGKLLLKQSNRKIEVRLWRNYTILPQKYLHVQNKTQDGYQLRLLSSDDHWALNLLDTNLNEVFDDNDQVTIDENVIKASWDNIPYVPGNPHYSFPPIHFGKFLNPGKPLILQNPFDNEPHVGMRIEDFRPVFSLTWLLKKMFCKHGWKLVCPLLDTTFWESVWVYILSNEFYKQDENIELAETVWQDSNTYNFTTQLTNSLAEGFLDGNPDFAQQLTMVATPSIVDGLGTSTAPETLSNWWYDGATVYEVPAEGTIEIKGTINPGSTGYVGTFGGYASVYINVHFFDELTGKFYIYDTVEFPIVDPDNPEEIEVETSIDFTNLSGRKIFFTYGIRAWGDRGTPMQTWVMSLRYEFRPESTFYGNMSTWKFRDVVRSNESSIDLFKGFMHAIKGKIITDFKDKTVYVYPPKDVTVSSTAIEGFLQLDESIDLREKMNPDSLQTVNPDFTRARRVLLGYKATQDPRLEQQIVSKKQFLDNEFALGPDFKEGTDEDRNPYFVPVPVERFLLDISAHPIRFITLPSMIDNDDDRLSYDIGPAMLIFTNKSTKDALLNNGTNLGAEELKFMAQDITTGFPSGYMAPPSNVALPSPYDTYNIAYGQLTNDLYSRYIRHDMFTNIMSPLHSFDYEGHDEDFFLQDFRKRILIKVDGEDVYCRPLEDQLKGSRLIGLTVHSETNFETGCSEITPEVSNCLNSPKIIGSYTPGTNTWDFSIGGQNQSTIDTYTWEYQYETSPNVWPTSWTSLGSASTAQIVNPTARFRVRCLVTYTDSCPDMYTPLFTKDRCGNYPVLNIVKQVNGDGHRGYKILLSGTTQSTVDTVTIMVSENGEAASSYTLGTDVFREDLESVEITTATVTYTNTCPDTVITNILATWIDGEVEEDVYRKFWSGATSPGGGAVDYVEVMRDLPDDDYMKKWAIVKISRTNEYHLDNALTVADRMVYRCNRATTPHRLEFIENSIRGAEIYLKIDLTHL